MTVRPRYTIPAKAHDVATVWGRAYGTVLPTLRAIARQITPALIAETRRIVTARYTDPKEPQ